MKSLTKAEEQIMQIIWQKERCLVRDIVDALETPIPQTTVSSVVRILERKGFVSHKAYGKTYEYFPAISKEEYTKTTFSKLFAGYFDSSPSSLLSFMVKEEKLTEKDIAELQKIINQNK